MYGMTERTLWSSSERPRDTGGGTSAIYLSTTALWECITDLRRSIVYQSNGFKIRLSRLKKCNLYHKKKRIDFLRRWIN